MILSFLITFVHVIIKLVYNQWRFLGGKRDSLFILCPAPQSPPPKIVSSCTSSTPPYNVCNVPEFHYNYGPAYLFTIRICSIMLELLYIHLICPEFFYYFEPNHPHVAAISVESAEDDVVGTYFLWFQ